MRQKPWKIISVGGSIIIPKTGFDIDFLKKFRNLFVARLEKRERFILIIGGGATCRQYQAAAKSVVPLTNEDLDWIGIHTTRFNAEFVKYLFRGYAHGDVAINPNKKVITDKNLIIGAGFEPGCSTDTDAVLIAKTFGATELVNMSNIEYAYDKDPKKFSDAKKIESICWEEFIRDVVGEKWEAGMNLPFDPIASREAEKIGLTVKILNGIHLEEIEKALDGEKFVGTVIHP